MILLEILRHHGEPGDPTLLTWIQDALDSLFGSGPAVVVAVLGFVIVAMPVGLMVVCYLQRRKQDDYDEELEQDEIAARDE